MHLSHVRSVVIGTHSGRWSLTGVENDVGHRSSSPRSDGARNEGPYRVSDLRCYFCYLRYVLEQVTRALYLLATGKWPRRPRFIKRQWRWEGAEAEREKEKRRKNGRYREGKERKRKRTGECSVIMWGWVMAGASTRAVTTTRSLTESFVYRWQHVAPFGIRYTNDEYIVRHSLINSPLARLINSFDSYIFF